MSSGETQPAAANPPFLYPFLQVGPQTDRDGSERSTAQASVSGTSLDELTESARSAWAAALAFDELVLRENEQAIASACSLLVEAVDEGGRIFALGNGGSACDAARFVRQLKPSIRARLLLDPVILSALANDVGSERIFERQVETFVRANDVVVAFTTSGTSPNVLRALGRARAQGAHTVVLAGYGGAALIESPDVDVCLAVRSSSVHRIQEAQGVLADALVQRLADRSKEDA